MTAKGRPYRVPLGLACLTLGACLLRISYPRAPEASEGCDARPGGEQLGVFVGDSLQELAPLEEARPAVEGAGAWPAANPVTLAGGALKLAAPSLLATDERLYAFYEDGAGCGRLAAAESIDAGLTWRPWGALQLAGAEQPLSGPFVFRHVAEVYLAASTASQVSLFRATQFPAAWEVVRTLVEAPLRSVSLTPHNGSWWLFGSEPGPRSRGGGRGAGGGSAAAHGLQRVFHSASSPLGPWEPHASSAVGADMFGRPAEQLDGGGLLRFGRPCERGRCGSIHAFEVTLGEGGYHQRMLAAAGPLLQHSKQVVGWDSAGHSHMDVVRLPNGRWLAAATGSSTSAVPPRAARLLQAATLLLTGLAAGAVLALVVHLHPTAGRLLGRTAWGRALLARARRKQAPLLSAAVPNAPTVYISLVAPGLAGMGGKLPCSRSCNRIRRPCGSRRVPWRTLVLSTSAAALVGAAVTARVLHAALGPYWEQPQQVSVDGRASKFTLMVMSYDKRAESLKTYIRHYGQCPSVGEILVVWNKGTPPSPERDLQAPVPVRVRVESTNSMNNRYKPDPLIKYRAVLSLDDDILMPCSDVERGFAAWRRRPETIVGYYPRLITTGQDGRLEYNWEDTTVAQGNYNAILTGAAFLDSRTAFSLYWADAVAPARALVDQLQNCDDLLMNFVVANASWPAREASRQRLQSSGSGAADSGSSSARSRSGLEVPGQAGAVLAQAPGDSAPVPVLEFIRPQRRVDISYLSGVGLSHNWERFQRQAEQCLGEFAHLFGGNPLQTRAFDWSTFSPPYCGIPALGCLYM